MLPTRMPLPGSLHPERTIYVTTFLPIPFQCQRRRQNITVFILPAPIPVQLSIIMCTSTVGAGVVLLTAVLSRIANYVNGGAPTGGWISGDVNSVAGDPNFINPTGNIAAVNLHINTTALL